LLKNSFVTDPKLKAKPFYGLKFHRVISDFMIQTGDPTGTAQAELYSFKDEFLSDLKFDKGGIWQWLIQDLQPVSFYNT
jgi:cyclophilin family peptidyl-prolyl cis-trans isomerase